MALVVVGSTREPTAGKSCSRCALVFLTHPVMPQASAFFSSLSIRRLTVRLSEVCKRAFHLCFEEVQPGRVGKVRLQPGGDPLLMMEMAQQMGQVGQEGCINWPGRLVTMALSLFLNPCR